MQSVTTESFGGIQCDFYRNMNDDIMLTREQIGKALGYANPVKSIQKIHLAHKDRLDPLSVSLKSGHPQTGYHLNKSEEQERTFYSERGIMEICRWSRQPLANDFMDWCWDVIEKYRHGTLQPDFNKLIEPLSNMISSVSTAITSLSDRMTTLEQSQQQKQLPKKKFSHWTSKMFPKYQLLMDYFGVDRKELYHNLFVELQNTYPDLDLQQLQDDYCYENNLESCFTMDVIEHITKLRQMFELIVDSLLEKNKLSSDPLQPIRRETIFDN